jgi:hypothetical protein
LFSCGKASRASDPSHCDFQIKSFINWPACKIQEQRNGGVFAGWVSRKLSDPVKDWVGTLGELQNTFTQKPIFIEQKRVIQAHGMDPAVSLFACIDVQALPISLNSLMFFVDVNIREPIGADTECLSISRTGSLALSKDLPIFLLESKSPGRKI